MSEFASTEVTGNVSDKLGAPGRFRTFERADELSVGEEVLAADGRVLVVGGLRPAGAGTAYNLAVHRIHTHHVGVASVLVHNQCGPSDELLNYADDHIGQTNMASEVVAADGRHAFGVSMPRTADDLTPNVRVAAEATGHHMGCAEIGGLCDLKAAGSDLVGARADAVIVGGRRFPLESHGESAPMCRSCVDLFNYVGGGQL